MSAAGPAVADRRLLEILACPLTHTALELHDGELVSRAARLAFPIRDGVPVMLVSEARSLTEAELRGR